MDEERDEWDYGKTRRVSCLSVPVEKRKMSQRLKEGCVKLVFMKRCFPSGPQRGLDGHLELPREYKSSWRIFVTFRFIVLFEEQPRYFGSTFFLEHFSSVCLSLSHSWRPCVSRLRTVQFSSPCTLPS